MLNENYYSDIDEFPWWNWKRCQKGEIEHTRKTGSGSKKEDIETWDNLYDGYLKEFGLGKEYAYYFELKGELIELQCRLVIEENNFLQNRINVLEMKIGDILKKGEKQGSDKAIVHLSKWMGTIINEKTTSVRMVYQMMEEYKIDNEAKK